MPDNHTSIDGDNFKFIFFHLVGTPENSFTNVQLEYIDENYVSFRRSCNLFADLPESSRELVITCNSRDLCRSTVCKVGATDPVELFAQRAIERSLRALLCRLHI